MPSQAGAGGASGGNFGEAGKAYAKMLSNKGIRLFSPPHADDIYSTIQKYTFHVCKYSNNLRKLNILVIMDGWKS